MITEYVDSLLWRRHVTCLHYIVLYFVIFIRILIIYIADHRFIPAVPLCSADRFFFIRINKDISRKLSGKGKGTAQSALQWCETHRLC